jgi:hypothetical protein
VATPRKKNPKKGGRPKARIDETLVEQLAKIACTHEEIAAVCGCCVETIARRFADRIKEWRGEGHASLRRMQYKKALEGNTTMLVWLGKNELGQSDKQQTDITTAGKALPGLSAEQYAKLAEEREGPRDG